MKTEVKWALKLQKSFITRERPTYIFWWNKSTGPNERTKLRYSTTGTVGAVLQSEYNKWTFFFKATE